MKVIVTGGAGFIGSHFCDVCVENGCKVTVIDNFSTGRWDNISHLDGKINVVEADISSTGQWMASFKDAQFVVHLAALADIVPSIEDPRSYFASNVTGTLNVLSAAKDCNVGKLVYAASSSCYGIAKEFPTPESAVCDPQYPYALTKYMGEKLVLHWNKVYGLPSISLRFFNVFGTRSRTSGAYGAMFGVFLAQKLAGKPLTVVGDGKQTRDFTYVTDVARAIWSAANCVTVGEVFNVGSGQAVSIKDIVSLLDAPSIHIPKRPGEPDVTHADITKISRELGWAPKVSLIEGVGNMLNEISYWKDAVVWTPDTIEMATKSWFEHLGKK